MRGLSTRILPRGLVVLGLVALLAAGCGPGSPSSEERAPDRWRPLAAGPLSGRFQPAAVWTGREMLIWGGAGCDRACSGDGIRTHADGAAYDPLGDTWRSLPPSPLAARSGPLAVWSGRELIVWGGMSGGTSLADGAAFDPATNRWRSLPASPLAGRFAAPPGTVAQIPGVWTGTEMVVWGQGAGLESDEPELPVGAAYDPAADRWRLLAPPPVSPRIVEAVWTGREMLVWGGQSGRRYFDDGAAYDPAADRWRLLPPSPLAARFTFAVWSGERMLVWGGESSNEAFGDGAAYDPASDSWRPLPPSPLEARRGFARVSTGTELIVWGGAPGSGAGLLATGGAYDPARGRWREIGTGPARLLPVALWTGREVILWGGIVSTASGLLASSAEGGRMCLHEPCPRP